MVKKNDVIPAAEGLQPGVGEAALDEQIVKTAEQSVVVVDAQPVVADGGIVNDDGAEQPELSLVFIYDKNREMAENSLIYALRSVDRYLKCSENYNIVVVGDKPDRLNAFVDHVQFEQVQTNSQMTELLKALVAADCVADRFILMPENLVLVDFVSLAHLQIAKHKGVINPKAYTGADRDVMTRTHNFIADFLEDGMSCFDFNTHSPLYFEKDKVVDSFENCKQIEELDLQFVSIYQNVYSVHPVMLNYERDEWLLPVVSERPLRQNVEKYIANKCMAYFKYPANMICLEPVDKLCKDRCMYEMD